VTATSRPATQSLEAQRAAKAQVHRYYDATTEDYLRYYETDWHHHMHYGFDRALPPGGNPTEHMVRYLAKVAGIQGGERVLDAGCGVGGSSIWLAGNLACRCVGITLVESQARLARGFAQKRGVSASARFVVDDFTRAAFSPGSFDVVWALESFDHAPDKAAWIADMFRLLKPGGRLVVADGFRAEGAFSPADENAYRKFLAGWAVPHLCTPSEMERWGNAAGFAPRHAENITADVLPHARAIFRFGVLFIPCRWILRKLGLISEEKLGNARATYYQYRTLKKNLWSYRVFCFSKPHA
jgi:cyclopropane fatty-acyl-phospholipid synthase-like methyltransferase